MLTIVRDRVQHAIGKGLHARPRSQAASLARDYDGRYGARTGPASADVFIETAFRSSERRAAIAPQGQRHAAPHVAHGGPHDRRSRPCRMRVARVSDERCGRRSLWHGRRCVLGLEPDDRRRVRQAGAAKGANLLRSRSRGLLPLGPSRAALYSATASPPARLPL